MKGRKLDGTNDICLSGNGVARTGTLSSTVAQRVSTMLKTFQGECYTDRYHGIPWYGGILGESVLDIGYAKAILKEKIMEVPGVKDVQDISVTVKGRVLSGAFSLVCSDGSSIKGAY